jgi:periplasmic divalent cation tolerance protein
MSEVVLVLTTVPDEALAARIARALVEERLAACVNVLPPMRSIYRWRDEVEEAEERQLLVKTTRARAAEVQARIGSLHTYELPECLVLSVDGGSPTYLRWIGDSL